jgi:hypothetical protein
MGVFSNKDQFIHKARSLHGNHYDYSKVEYIGSKVEVLIICPKHGEFYQKPNVHLQGSGCRKCGYEKNARSQTLGLEGFLKRAYEKHGDKFDYSKVEYIDAHTSVKIICPNHGIFSQKPYVHFGHGCPKCSGVITHRRDSEEFIKTARKKHGNKYDYSKTEYINAESHVIIICSEHGEFSQIAKNHLKGHGCPNCYGNMRRTFEVFLQEATAIHGEQYDYSLANYRNDKTPLILICKTHGKFFIQPRLHLKAGKGCPICDRDKKSCQVRDRFIQDSRRVHKDKYFYCEVRYENNKTSVTIYCPTHGFFNQTPDAHRNGHGCPGCKTDKLSKLFSKDTKQFVEEAQKVHGNDYDYSSVSYVNSKTQVIIICPVHGEFNQKAGKHLLGNGCPKCKSSQGERKIDLYLQSKNVAYESQYRFKDCKHKGQLPFDFALLDDSKKVVGLIEYNGAQHYTPIEAFGGEKSFKTLKIRDGIKEEYCNGKNIPLRVIPYTQKHNIEEILLDFIQNAYNDKLHFRPK